MADQPIQQNTGMAANIFAQIRNEQYDFMYNWISIVPGYPFNTYWTIKRIHLYLNSKYEDLTNYFGREKIFFNIVIPPCEVATRMLNLETKDIRLWPTNPKSQFSTFLLEKELKLWLKNNKFGKVLSQIAEECPRFGSVLIEKTIDGAELCDLRRTIYDPTVENIQDSRFITRISYMTPTQLRESGWDSEMVEEAIARFQNSNTTEPYEDNYVNVNVMRSSPYIKIFKRYGEVPAWWLDEKLKPGTIEGDKTVKSLYIVAGADWLMKANDGKMIPDYGVVLFKSKWRKDWPFKDFHYMKTKGRWLGIGIVEMLFDVQMRVNEMKNQKRIAMELSSMHIFQTKDKTIVRNVLTDLQSGDVILAGKEGGLEPLANEERNLPAFKDEEQAYMNQTDRLSFAYEALRGDTGDASTPLGTTQLAVAQGTSVFAFKKKNYGLFLEEFFNELVLPQLMKDLTPEHIMRFVGTSQELQKLDQAAAEIYANDYVKDQLLKGKLVTLDHADMAKQKALKSYQKLGTNRFLKLKENFYKDAEFEFDFLITAEQADPAKMATNIQAVITEISGNPNILQDPRLKLLFFKLLDQLGISQAEIELADQQAGEQQANQTQQNQGRPDVMNQNTGIPTSTLMRLGASNTGKIPAIPQLPK